MVLVSRFEQQLKLKLEQKCTSNQSTEGFLVKAFKFFDFANSGEVNFQTFSRAIAKMGVVVEDEDLSGFFEYYDRNGNGTLDYNEFTAVIF
jgi:Ca2+-binding EF-hand superfamily protein